jgi:hypothetical protein
MRDFRSSRRLRAAAVAAAALALAAAATVARASRVAGAPAPAASSVQGATHQPAHVQADESASLREGTIGAVDERGGRVQVQGIWLELAPGKTRLLRGSEPAGLDTLKAGETIRFTVLPGSGSMATLKVIYAP